MSNHLHIISKNPSFMLWVTVWKSFLWDCINFDRAKRKFHVCLGVSHEKECFQEIAAGLSYKAVGKKSFRQIRSDLKRQVTIKIHPQRLSDNRKSFNFDIGLVKLDRKVFFGPDLSPICLKVFFNEIPCDWTFKGLLATSTLEQQSREVFISGYGLTLYRWPSSIWPIHYRAQEEGL